MAKQPSEVEAPEEALIEEAPGKGKGRGTRARVTLEGDVPPSTLQRVIPGDPTAPDVPTKAGKMPFSKAIRNTEWRIFAERLSPRTMPDGTVLEDIFEIPSYDSITENDVKKEIQQARGGTRWIARVIDVENNNRVMATKLFVIGGDPIPDPTTIKSEPGGPGQGGNFDTGGDESPEDAEARVASEIEAAPEVIEAKKRARIEQLDLEKLRRDTERAKIEAEKRRVMDELNPPKQNSEDAVRRAIEDATKPLRESNERLQRELDEKRKADEHKRDLDANLAPMKEAISALTQKLNAPQPQQGPTAAEIMAKLDAVKAEIKNDTTQQIANALNNLTTKFEAQLSNITTQLNTFMSRPQDGGTLANAAVSALTKIATEKDGGGRSDPFETTAKVFDLVKGARELTGIDTKGETTVPPDFPSFLVDRVTNLAPQVIEYLEKKQGGPIGREELEKMFKEYGIRMWQELDGTIKREVRGGLQKIATARPSLPPPGAPVRAPAPAPGAPFPPPPGAPGAQPLSGVPQPVPSTPPPQAPEAPPPPSVPIVRFGVPPAPAPVAAPAPAPAPAFSEASIEAETRDRVNWVLNGLLREMKLGVQEMQWPEKAYGNLPKDVLDRIVTASSDRDIYDAISPWADQKIMDAIYAYVTDSNPQHDFYRQWLTAGVNWIKDEATGANTEPEGEPEK